MAYLGQRPLPISIACTGRFIQARESTLGRARLSLVIEASIAGHADWISSVAHTARSESSDGKGDGVVVTSFLRQTFSFGGNVQVLAVRECGCLFVNC